MSQATTPPQRRPLLSEMAKMEMMAVLLRNEKAFLRVRSKLLPSKFGPYDRAYALCWRQAQLFYNDNNKMPDEMDLWVRISDAVTAEPEIINSSEYKQLEDLMKYAFDDAGDKPLSANMEAIAVKRTIDYLSEQLQLAALDSLQPQGAQVLINWGAALEEHSREYEELQALEVSEHDKTFPADWFEGQLLKLLPTGYEFMNNLLGNGHACGEVYGLAGPYGSCKSTFGYGLAVRSAKHYHANRVEGKPLEVAVVVSYEDRIKSMQMRTMIQAATIQRSRLERLSSRSELSTSNNLCDYEKLFWKEKLDSGLSVPGEQERMAEAEQLLNDHLILLDMTGYSRRGVGGGGIQEIKSLIMRRLAAHDKPRVCRLVVVDYVGAMVNRMIEGGGAKQDDLRHLIQRAPLAARTWLADTFDCPVWLLHQLSGEANSRTEGFLASSTDTAECKSFAENLDFMFVIGKPSDANVTQLGMRKHRRVPPQGTRIIKLVGEFGDIIDVSENYTVIDNRIVPKSFSEKVVAPAAPSPTNSENKDSNSLSADAAAAQVPDND